VAALGVVATLLPDHADAQGRRGRAIGPRRGGVVVAAYYRPVFYDPFFYDPWFYPYRFGGYPPYPYYGYGQFYDGSSSLRVQVSPRETEVFIDGYYAGTVDDFDGFFQRLRLDRGEHEVTLYLAGHRSITQKIFLQPGGTFRIRHTMEPLPAGAPPEPRPVALAGPPPGTQGPQGPTGAPPARPAPRAGDSTFGAIAIRVQPADAEVFIDGEQWEGPAADEALIVQIAPGGHTIEVRKDGYRSYTAQLDVRAGETTPINISLPRQ
jgi:PEGA domain